MISRNQRTPWRGKQRHQGQRRRRNVHALASLTLGAVLALPATAQTTDTGSELLATAVASQQGGAAGLLYGKRVRELTPQAMRRLALTQAPLVQALASQRRVAEAGLIQQQAGFDWVLGASATYRKTDFFERSEVITRERATLVTVSGDDLGGDVPDEEEDDTTPDVDEEGNAIAVQDSAGNLLCITVDGELVNPEQCALQTEISTEREFASGGGDPTDTWTFSLTGDRQFAMGSLLQLSLTLSRRNKNFYPLDNSGLISAISADDPIGNGSRYPWASTLAVTYSTPLPFGSGFGERGSASALGLRLASISAEQSRPLEDANVANALVAVEAQYWAHARNWLALQSNVSIRNALDARLASAERRFNARELTNYELAQVRAAKASAMANEALAWAEFIASSGQLAASLGLDDGDVIEPTGIDSVALPELAERNVFVRRVLDSNPQITVSRLSVDAGEAVLNFSEETLKPDLNVVLSLGLSQSDAVLGYESATDSLSNVFDPDNTRWFAGLSYRLPFGRQAEKARREQASLSLRRAQNSVRQTEVALAASAGSHYAQVAASQRLLTEARERVRLAESAFERALTARNRGVIPEFEFIAATSELARAELDYAARVAEAGQLATVTQALLGDLSLTTGESQ